jgi:hemoglobin
MGTETTSLYDILGGQAVVEVVVAEFYRRVLDDSRINHYFLKVDLDKLHKHQAAFVAHLLGGPHPYMGRDMAEAHSGLHLSKSDFDAVAGHMVAALERHAVAQIHIDAVISKIAALEREITYK